MSAPTDAWTTHTTGRERVRMVVDLLDTPATTAEIANRANVTSEAARRELNRLAAAGKVRETTEGEYLPNQRQQFLDQIRELARTKSPAELASTIDAYREQIVELERDYGVSSPSQLRDRFDDDDLPEEHRTVRRVSETWEALEFEVLIRKHALLLADRGDW